MDFASLIDEVTRRVAAQMTDVEQGCACGLDSGAKPKLLVLTHAHGETCHALVDSERLNRDYQVDCALLRDWDCDLDDYKAVILFQLSCEALAKIAAGITDTDYTKLASKAILMGKKVFVPKEEVELFHYRETVPRTYYEMFLEKLNFLAASGVKFCPAAELEEAILSMPVENSCASADGEKVCCSSAGHMVQQEAILDKRVITEKDVIEVCMNGATCLIVGPRAIVTDLARDYAKERRLAILTR